MPGSASSQLERSSGARWRPFRPHSDSFAPDHVAGLPARGALPAAAVRTRPDGAATENNRDGECTPALHTRATPRSVCFLDERPRSVLRRPGRPGDGIPGRGGGNLAQYLPRAADPALARGSASRPRTDRRRSVRRSTISGHRAERERQDWTLERVAVFGREIVARIYARLEPASWRGADRVLAHRSAR